MQAGVWSVVAALGLASVTMARGKLATDVLPTAGGDLAVTFVGHGTLMVAYNGKVVHVDPCGILTDYTQLPKADLILVTHEHPDHLDTAAIRLLSTDKTSVIIAPACRAAMEGGTVMTNGETRTVQGLQVEAVPAYNLAHKRENGQPYHPKGAGNGYVLTFGDRRVYVAGDTENTPELKALKAIEVAFLPMNLPYTMTPEMVADAAGALRPRILYPYHCGETDTARLADLLKDVPAIDVRLRNMK